MHPGYPGTTRPWHALPQCVFEWCGSQQNSCDPSPQSSYAQSVLCVRQCACRCCGGTRWNGAERRRLQRCQWRQLVATMVRADNGVGELRRNAKPRACGACAQQAKRCAAVWRRCLLPSCSACTRSTRYTPSCDAPQSRERRRRLASAAPAPARRRPGCGSREGPSPRQMCEHKPPLFLSTVWYCRLGYRSRTRCRFYCDPMERVGRSAKAPDREPAAPAAPQSRTLPGQGQSLPC